MNELYGEKEGWESEKRNLEEMCASLMVEVERLRSGGNIGSGSGGGLKLEPTIPSSSFVSSRHSGPSTSSPRHSYQLPKEKRTPVACPICPDPDPDCPCQQPQSQAAPVAVPEPHHSDCGLCQTPAECLCRIVNEAPLPKVKGKCDVCPSLAICLCEDDSPPPIPKPAQPLSLRLKSKSSGIDTGPKKTFWRLDNVIKKGEAVCSGDPSNCDACKDDTFGMFAFLITFTLTDEFRQGILWTTLWTTRNHSTQETMYKLSRKLHVHPQSPIPCPYQRGVRGRHSTAHTTNVSRRPRNNEV